MDYKKFAEFMMIFLDIKPSSTYKFKKSISKKAKQTLDCIRNFSCEKFKDLLKLKEMKILIKKIYKHDLDELFSQVKTMEMNRDRYINAIEEIIDIS